MNKSVSCFDPIVIPLASDASFNNKGEVGSQGALKEQIQATTLGNKVINSSNEIEPSTDKGLKTSSSEALKFNLGSILGVQGTTLAF
jgi:hypothetical protein